MAAQSPGARQVALLAVAPAASVCALAFLLVLPFKLIGGCGTIPPSWWAYASVLPLLPGAALGILVVRVRWNLAPRRLAPAIGLLAAAIAVVLLPELNVVRLITTC